jgi:hypothetical protein
MTMTMRRKLELILCGVGVTVDDARGTADEILDALEEASEEMLAPIACLIAPDDLPDGVVEHPIMRSCTRCLNTETADTISSTRLVRVAYACR